MKRSRQSQAFKYKRNEFRRNKKSETGKRATGRTPKHETHVPTVANKYESYRRESLSIGKFNFFLFLVFLLLAFFTIAIPIFGTNFGLPLGASVTIATVFGVTSIALGILLMFSYIFSS